MTMPKYVALLQTIHASTSFDEKKEKERKKPGVRVCVVEGSPMQCKYNTESTLSLTVNHHTSTLGSINEIGATKSAGWEAPALEINKHDLYAANINQKSTVEMKKKKKVGTWSL
jgi:hypothetical protein